MSFYLLLSNCYSDVANKRVYFEAFNSRIVFLVVLVVVVVVVLSREFLFIKCTKTNRHLIVESCLLFLWGNYYVYCFIYFVFLAPFLHFTIKFDYAVFLSLFFLSHLHSLEFVYLLARSLNCFVCLCAFTKLQHSIVIVFFSLSSFYSSSSSLPLILSIYFGGWHIQFSVKCKSDLITNISLVKVK